MGEGVRTVEMILLAKFDAFESSWKKQRECLRSFSGLRERLNSVTTVVKNEIEVGKTKTKEKT